MHSLQVICRGEPEFGEDKVVAMVKRGLLEHGFEGGSAPSSLPE